MQTKGKVSFCALAYAYMYKLKHYLIEQSTVNSKQSILKL